ncbi:hypothetical protein [Methanobrevibacter sp.]|uniref:hypothetical protein n=1 Tax=Methanobrevibacter sp. TaxID=66852 RepID=UPI00386FF41F
MKFKKFFLILCLVICLFTMVSVCASEVNDTAITAIDLQDNLEINEDNQVIDDDNYVGAKDSTNNASTEGNVEISAPETVENSYSDKLGITDDDLIGEELRANVIALNVSALDNALFVVDCADDFNGNVSINAGDHQLYNGSVKALIEASKLPAGNYVATALFYGDDKYGELTLNDIRFTVSRVTPTIYVNVEDITYPRIAYVTVHIGNNANGTVNVTVGGKTFNGTVSDGKANVSLYGLGGGSKEVDVKFFSNDYCNNNVSASTKFVVLPNNSLIQINCSEFFHVGEDIEFTVTTTNSTGDLTLCVNGVYYNKYRAQRSYEISIADKYEGQYVLSFDLAGDENYTGYSTSATVHVTKNDLTINVENIDEVIYVNQPVILKAKLSNVVKGNVTFTINGAKYTEYVDNSDVVTHVYTPVNNDTLTVIATFDGNYMYKSNVSSSKDFNVSRIDTEVYMDFLSTIIAGDDAYIYVSMNPKISGTVKLRVGDKFYDVAVVEGSGMYSVSNLAKAVLDVEVIFEGDCKYAPSTSEVKSLFVSNIPTSLSISIDKTSMSYHDSAVVSVNLNRSINAVVTVKVNGNNNTVGLVNGKGSFTLYGLNKDEYIINAVFAGDDRYNGSTSNALNLTVTGDNISSSVSISLNKDSVFVGDEVIVRVNINSTVTGVIRLNIGSNSYNVVVNKGVGIFTISDLANGTYDVQAIFDGDNEHSGNSSDVKQLEVKKIPTSLSVSIDNSSISVGDSVVVDFVLNQAINNVLTVNVNDKEYLIGIVNGKGNLTLSDLPFGIYTVNATFAGEGKYVESSSNNVTIEVNKIKTQLTGDPITVSYNGNGDLVITLKDTNGNAVRNAKLTVDLNGVKSFNTDNSGQIKVSTNALDPNTYVAKITFDGNSVYDQSSNDIKVTVIKANPKMDAKAKTFKVKVKTKKYEITLKDSNGNAIKNARVTLKVKGKTFKATTDSKGKATFKIKNLKKRGTYKAVITYGGNKLYNKLSVNANIKAK